MRAVAAEAGVSHALVLFHFGRESRLVQELLDWVIDGAAVLHISDDVAQEHVDEIRGQIYRSVRCRLSGYRECSTRMPTSTSLCL